MSLIRDGHGGAVSVQLVMGEILVGVDENADTGKDRPHFVSFKPHQVTELIRELKKRISEGGGPPSK